MANKASWRLAIIAVLVVALGLLVHAGLATFDSQRPAAPPEQAPAAAPSALPAAQAPSPEPATQPGNGQMRMAEAPEPFTPAPPAADYSYSLRQQRSERTVLPGVTVGPGKTLNVKTAKKDETIRITRDSTYPSSDYQVMWQKKY